MKQESFGKQLAKFRKAAGISQGQISAKFGLKTAQYISNVERDKCPLATKHYKKLAKLIGVEATKSLIQTAKRAKMAELDGLL